MINFHPSESQLYHFANGMLSPNLSLIVSAHCDLCPQCQQRLWEATQQLADENLTPYAKNGESLGFDRPGSDELALFGDMLQNIMDLPPQNNPAMAQTSPAFLDLDGKHFPLPRTLARFAHQTTSWKKLVGKLWQAQVDIGGEARAEFIYMEKGGSVPEHTHRGNEWTLVINGEFEDGHHHFDTGDLILLDGQHTHAPVSNDPDGCLVFSILDRPLHFTSGLARLLNPFSHLFFK